MLEDEEIVGLQVECVKFQGSVEHQLVTVAKRLRLIKHGTYINRTRSFEMWCRRRILGVLWEKHQTDESRFAAGPEAWRELRRGESGTSKAAVSRRQYCKSKCGRDGADGAQRKQWLQTTSGNGVI